MKPYYDQDGITIYLADCADVLALVEPSTVALLLTDPPYGMRLDTDYAGFLDNFPDAWPGKTHPKVGGDDQPFDPSPFLIFPRCVIWGANHFASRLPDSAGWLCWNKRGNGPPGTYIWGDCELAWTRGLGFKSSVKMFNHLWAGYQRASEIGYHVHPTQKPVALMRWILERWTEPGDLIFDPYMGSGPIAQACHEMQRRYIGVEIVEDYCQVAVQRLAQGVLVYGETP